MRRIPQTIYRSKKPCATYMLDEAVIKHARETPGIISPTLRGLADKVEECLETNRIIIKSVHGNPNIPHFLHGIMSVEDILHLMCEEQMPGDDCFLEGVEIWEGYTRLRKERFAVYALRPLSEGERQSGQRGYTPPRGSVEVIGAHRNEDAREQKVENEFFGFR